jgi:hypothetical protein
MSHLIQQPHGLALLKVERQDLTRFSELIIVVAGHSPLLFCVRFGVSPTAG